MSNIIISTGSVASDDSAQQIDVSVFVRDEDWVGRFNRLQVFRSELGAAGPFEEITGGSWSRPRLPVDGGDEPGSPVSGALVNVVGQQLDLVIQDEELAIVFTGSDPLTLLQVAGQIEAQSNQRLNSYVDSSGVLVIEAVTPGLASRLEILSSSAQLALGLIPDSVSGRDSRPTLVQGQNQYVVCDYFSSINNYYRVRLLDGVTGSQSEPSTPSSAQNRYGVDVSSAIIGYVDLVLHSGIYMEGAEVRLFSESGGPLVDGKLVTGGATVKYTDERGHVEFSLVRGQRVTVSVQGTTHVRTVTVPTDPSLTRFNFFDPSVAADDVFKVSVPDIITAERRTL